MITEEILVAAASNHCHGVNMTIILLALASERSQKLLITERVLTAAADNLDSICMREEILDILMDGRNPIPCDPGLLDDIWWRMLERSQSSEEVNALA